MFRASISESPANISTWLIKRARWAALLVVAMFTYVLPAAAQSGDTWKSVAIIGGSTAAGAYLGHKVAGRKGAYIGAAVGASAGYAIDRHRRQNENNNNGDYPYGGGYYPDNGGYPSNDPNAGNGGYYPDSQNNYPYPPDQSGNDNTPPPVLRRR